MLVDNFETEATEYGDRWRKHVSTKGDAQAPRRPEPEVTSSKQENRNGFHFLNDARRRREV